MTGHLLLTTHVSESTTFAKSIIASVVLFSRWLSTPSPPRRRPAGTAPAHRACNPPRCDWDDPGTRYVPLGQAGHAHSRPIITTGTKLQAPSSNPSQTPHLPTRPAHPGLMLRRHTANGLHTISSRCAPLPSLTVRCPRCIDIYAQHASHAVSAPPPSRVHFRGKKTKTVVKLSDLPQGVIQTESLPEQEPKNEPAYPTVVLQARRNMDKFDNCVLLTRVGGFYELYFEHADEFAPLLNLKLASKKTSAGPVPMVSRRISRFTVAATELLM